jgi:hypothetical protein
MSPCAVSAFTNASALSKTTVMAEVTGHLTRTEIASES